MPESHTDAAQGLREYVKGIDRGVAMKRLFVAFMAVIVVMGTFGPLVGIVLADVTATEESGAIKYDIESGDLTAFDVSQSSSATDARAAFGNYSAEITSGVNELSDDFADSSYDKVTMWVQTDAEGGTDDADIYIENNQNDGSDIISHILIGNDITVNTGSSLSYDVKLDTWYKLEWVFDYGGDEYDFSIYDENGTEVANDTNIAFENSESQVGAFRIFSSADGGENLFIDNIVAQTERTVSGTIADQDGNVLQGLDVTVNDSTESDVSDVVGDYELTLSDGTYEITAGGVSDAGQLYLNNSTTVTVSGSDLTGVDINVTEAQNVSGSVTEAGTSGPLNGLGNITISTNRSDQTATTATDSTGDYTIKLENNATHNITASSPNWFNETITVTINDSDKTGIDFALEDLHAHISGQVTSNKSGDVLEDVLVESDTTTANATTNNNGFYEFQIEPGKNIITASKSGFTDDTLTVWVNETTVSKDDHDLTDRDLVLGEANYTVNGTVNSSYGGTLENINITVVGEGVTTDTDANGDWNVSLPDGNYTIKAHHPHYFNESKDVEVDGGNVTGVDFTLDPVHAHLSGTVTYAKTGNPIEGALVTSNTTTANDTTDANGDYAFEIDRGVNNITASKSSYNDGSITVVVNKSTVSKNDHTLNNRDIQLTEPEDFIVSGQVTHVSTGDGVADVSVSTNLSDTTATTDNDGNYQIALDNGTHKLTFSKDKFKDNTTTVTVNGSDVSGVDVVLVEIIELQLKVPSHMWANTSDGYEVWDVAGDTDVEITDKATVTSSDPTNLTVYESNNTLVATSDITFSGVITITANYSDKSVSRDVTIANKSVENVDKFQNAADMFAGLWGDPVNPNTGERKGGTQLTMRVLFIAVLLGAAIVPLASAFAGIGMTTLVVAMGWFMGWVGDGMALVTVFTGLFIGLNVAANIDYSVRR